MFKNDTCKVEMAVAIFWQLLENFAYFIFQHLVTLCLQLIHKSEWLKRNFFAKNNKIDVFLMMKLLLSS